MRGPKNVSIAHKKIDAKFLDKRKVEKKSIKIKPNKKDSGAPKRPQTAFFIFMEEFRKIYKEKYPDSKSAPAVTKAGGDKWRSMSDSEKAPYVEKAGEKKAEYKKAMAAFKSGNSLSAKENPVTSEKSTSEVNDEGDDDASS